MDYRLERIRDHAVAHLYPQSETEDFVAQMQSHDFDAIVLSDDRIRIGKKLYRFTCETTAFRMADLLEDFVQAQKLHVAVSRP